ncbi:sorbosone dehydrogenase family protein [Nocardioides sp. cx-173]|uniref:PQQ-dependent sugar dehydrogenase n=1 Tax=Nocardioides sp. cx-173 TaxID=2898796 RepID=UPI001E3214BA|nr:PQQ-dependent sugar dehydrogenase [Nocardioides sp. cx-173]MCD4527472.1 PQQ-dependent sugar dehydrogenase [Nocardioides sp. cx-173]UGB40327.1 PQQ-dependent sugar dehydrogenase [Nocardioides sp. cx-173]
MRLTTLGVLLSLLLAGAPALAAPAPDDTGSAASERRAVPRLVVTKRVVGLNKPWDVKVLPGGELLISERNTARIIVTGKGGKRVVRFPSRQVWRSNETGLSSLEVDPGFAKNRRFYTCSGGFLKGGGHDVRVNVWTLNKQLTRARFVRKLIGGFPTSTGRHGGCRLLITEDGSMLIGTGDAAVGTHPRNLDSLGGKTLRVDRFSGKPWPTNPFAGADTRRRFVHTFGHRNVQGLAQRRDGSLWSVEHGSTRDDEVNKLVNGGDYGWHPVPGYNESVPMTDQSLPGHQVAAKWRSGSPTVATSGAAFVYGEKWGALNGTLAVATLKASRVLFLTFDATGKLVRKRVPAALTRFGRLRSVTVAPNGDLLITTDADRGKGAVLRVRPAS